MSLPTREEVEKMLREAKTKKERDRIKTWYHGVLYGMSYKQYKQWLEMHK